MNVTVYSTTTCPYCVRLKKWLADQNIDFTDYMIDKNPYAAQMMISQSGQMGVPFTTVEHGDGSVDKILGFDQKRLEQALQKHA